MQTKANPMRKNRDFQIGLVFNVVEGILSGSNFMLLYAVMQALCGGSLDMNRIGLLTGGLASIFVLRLIIYSTGYVRAQIGGAAVSMEIRLFLGDKLRRIPLARFSQGQMGQYVNTLTANVSSYEKILTHKTGDLAKNITLCALLIGFVGSIWIPAGLILLLGGLLLIPAMWLSFRAVNRYGVQKNAISAEAVSSIVEYVTGIQTLRAYGVGGARNRTTVAAMKAFSDISFYYEAKIIPVGFIYSILLWMTLPLTMWAASFQWINGTLDTVAYLLLCMLPLFFSKLCGTIFVDLTSYKNMMISHNQITGLMGEQEEKGCNSGFSPGSFEIAMRDVVFSYNPGEPVLGGVSFTAEDGKLTAVVGDSGSGKSTILNLIAKYYEPQSGSISIGGRSVKDVEAAQVLGLVSMVDQDVFLFDDTVRNNIRYARPDAADAEVEAACREANCHEFIEKLPGGYDTRIGENGNFLSGGERQRLSIARAILKNSPILLLDEATANLDIENELAVKQAVARLLFRKKTVIMIAHTLSVVRGADRILVVDKGKIAESGTHQELLRKGGKYADMWQAEMILSEG
ncbi:ABC transporter ATP-binding protein [Lacrimispora brassicae]